MRFNAKISKFLPAILIAVIFIGLVSSCGGRRISEKKKQEAQETCVQQKDTVWFYGFDEDSLRMVPGKVKKSEFFISLLKRLGMEHKEATNLSLAVSSDTVFSPRKLRAGNTFKAYYSQDDSLKYIIYNKDKIRSVVFQCFPPYSVKAVEKPLTRVKDYADVVINSSLWNDMVAAGVSTSLILTLSDIYAWTVDFFCLKRGDRFRVIYDKLYCDGQQIGIDTVYFSIFSHDGEDFYAVMYDQGDNGNLYWNADGESMRKAFLKAPLKYRRISSTFSYARKHPISGRVRPHTGVDYAAPKGTPVVAVGDGTVIKAGWGGGGGNTVKIRHNSVYTTAYLHLSKYGKGIKNGARVRQGQIIGYVGSTGASTGPHLDYRIWKNGSPINPLTLVSPPAEPLRQENRAAFDSLKLNYAAYADSLSTARHKKE